MTIAASIQKAMEIYAHLVLMILATDTCLGNGKALAGQKPNNT